jgi:hypothetical protein
MPAAMMRGAPGELMATPHRCSQGASGAGFRESRVEHLIYPARGRMSCRRAKVFASREPTSSGELPMASHQRTWTFMPAHRTVDSRVAHDIQGMVASAHLTRPTRPPVFLVHTTAASSGAARAPAGSANRAGAAAIDEGNGFPGREVAYTKDMYPSRWTRHGSTQCR